MSKSSAETYDEKLAKAFKLLLTHSSPEAIEICEALEKESPARSEHLFLLAVTALVLDDPSTALDLFTQGHLRSPEYLEFTQALASLNAQLGNLNDSVYYAKLGLVAESHPVLKNMIPPQLSNVEDSLKYSKHSYYNIEGWIALHKRKYSEAADYAQKEISLKSDDADSYFLLARAYAGMKRYQDGIHAIKQAIRYDPPNEEQLNFLGDLLRLTGNISEALEVYEEVIRRNPASSDSKNRVVCALGYSSEHQWYDAEAAAKSVLSLFADQEKKSGKGVQRQLPNPLERIRVAYLVNEFAISKYATFLETMLANRDEDLFRVNVYQQYSQPYMADSSLRAVADDWREVYDIDDLTLAKIIENDDIHVLIDMCGFESGNRHALLAKKVCPIQLNWLGFPLLAAAPVNDAVLVDGTVCNKEHLQNEEYHKVDGCVICYPGGSIGIELSNKNESPLAQNGFVTFGSAFEPSSLEANANLWSKILSSIPNSTLIVGGTGGIEQIMESKLESLFSDRDIAKRVKILHPSQTPTGRAEFLERIDVYLDANNPVGVDIVCDAMWMGAPVISLLGDRPNMRLSASAIKAAGYEHWIAENDHEFINLVKELCAGPAQITSLRKELRGTLLTSDLCNKVRYMERMEASIKLLCEKQLAV
ncbi:MAG: hypothetical protein CMF69_08975 [Magnetovibrio sp.]|nr:hypothetical protein [Magnetovibrio sp.]